MNCRARMDADTGQVHRDGGGETLAFGPIPSRRLGRSLGVNHIPPAEEWVRPPSEEAVLRAYAIFRDAVERVELLTGYEGDAFAFTGDAERDLLGITAVHPMREDALAAFLARAGADWSLVARLVAQGLLVETEYRGHRFYRRSRA